tara:strand:- start:3375 stop:3629 length:255 start_codon:yes stop_codon:yes gene_type:complete
MNIIELSILANSGTRHSHGITSQAIESRLIGEWISSLLDFGRSFGADQNKESGNANRPPKRSNSHATRRSSSKDFACRKGVRCA